MTVLDSQFPGKSLTRVWRMKRDAGETPLCEVQGHLLVGESAVFSPDERWLVTLMPSGHGEEGVDAVGTDQVV